MGNQYFKDAVDAISRVIDGAGVAVRTFLSFTLDVELEGHWPWQRTA
ncbi:MAG TPA: hypothetical protein VIM03_11780 [Thermoleophilaceae bacterium]